jgi:hypothetical protein
MSVDDDDFEIVGITGLTSSDSDESNDSDDTDDDDDDCSYPNFKKSTFDSIVASHQCLDFLRCPLQKNVILSSEVTTAICVDRKDLFDDYVNLINDRKTIDKIVVVDTTNARSAFDITLLSHIFFKHNVKSLKFFNIQSMREEDLFMLVGMLLETFLRLGKQTRFRAFTLRSTSIDKDVISSYRTNGSVLLGLFNAFIRLRNFKKLRVSLYYEDYELEYLVPQISHMTNLVNLNLSFSRFSKNADLPFSKLKKLQKLDLRKCTMSQEHIGQIAELIEKTTTLVHLDFSETCFVIQNHFTLEVAQKGFSRIAKVLPQNQTLRTLRCFQDGWQRDRTNLKILLSVLKNNIVEITVGEIFSNSTNNLLSLIVAILVGKPDMIECKGINGNITDIDYDKNWCQLFYDVVEQHANITGTYADSFWERHSEKDARIRTNKLTNMYFRNAFNADHRKQTLRSLLSRKLDIYNVPVEDHFVNRSEKRQREQ